MGDGVMETLCTHCVHLPVCSLKEMYLKAQNAVNEASFHEQEGNGVKVTDVANLRDWLTIPQLECRHYIMKRTGVRNLDAE